MIIVDPKFETNRIFVLNQLLLENGRQLEPLHNFLASAAIPLAAAHGCTGQIALEAIVSSHQPQVLYVQEFPSLAAWRECMDALRSNPEFAAAHSAWDHNNPYQGQNISLLSATSYSPLLEAAASDKPRIFELRLYQAASSWQLDGIHERFAGPEIPIFHRIGIHPVLFGSAIAGPQLPNMTYLTPFASLAEREAAWTRFQGDPEWHAVRQASIDKHGFTPRFINISLYKATAYSPVR